jgi:MinD-like ATPase involved in chromosome partitioning or flagellar assembly
MVKELKYISLSNLSIIMPNRPYVIFIASQKGGVGKTTVAVNLGTALRYREYQVLLIDTDVATYSISSHLGLKDAENDYSKAINGKIDVKEAIFSYEPLDLNLILGNQEAEEIEENADKINRFYNQVLKLNYDFVLIDSHPGPFSENMAKYINDVVILTTPDVASAKSSAKLAKYCEKHRIEHRLVINRIGSSKFELETEEVERLCGDVASVIIPEDDIVQESNTRHKPAYMVNKSAPFSLAIEELARIYMLKTGKPMDTEPETDRQDKKSFFQKLGGWSLGSK